VSDLLAGRELWLFAAVPWDFGLVGRTRYLAEGLVRQGARVTFVEPPLLKKWLERRVRPLARPSRIEVMGVPPTLSRITDRLPVFPRLHDRLQRRVLRARLQGYSPIALVSWPRWAPVIAGLDFEAVWYDCLDDIRVHGRSQAVAHLAWERQLIGQSRGAFAVAPALVESLRAKGCRRVELSRNGVPFDDFQRWASPTDPKGTRKRIGYVGALYEWVDLKLLEAAATAFPDHELYLIGPVRAGVDVSRLRALPNVRLLGPRPYQDVPKAMASFDVAIIPFEEGPVARGADPIKLYEYFCFGLPIVSTPVGDVERLGELVYVARGAEGFVAALRKALAEERPDLRQRRQQYARENDWAARAEAVAKAMTDTR